MFERYTENARRAIFFARYEASRVGASSIEAEHLLLGIIRTCEPELSRGLELKDLEDDFRADLAAAGRQEISSKRTDLPFANQSKRILAYGAEEAERLSSVEITSGHLLVGILREPESFASRFLLAHDVDLVGARQTIALLSGSYADNTKPSICSRVGWASRVGRRYWVGTASWLILLILFGAGVVRSNVTGIHLLVIGGIWSVAVIAWNILGPSSFGWSLGTRNRAIATTISYAFTWLFQLFMFGWLIPLGVGIYRVTR
jgi:hypothetical protein